MLTVAEAITLIEGNASVMEGEALTLGDALGRVTAEPVVSQCDSPPFDKALMDGYAVRSIETAHGSATLDVIETVMAGQVPMQSVGVGQAIRIMTGAPMPAGGDAVVPVERTMAAPQSNEVHVGVAVAAGANVLYRGESIKTGDRIFGAGHVLRAQDLGVLAELGVANVAVRRRPRVAVLATGDELVPPDSTPGPGQIRNSNETLLVGLVSAAGGDPVPLGIAKDDRESLRTKILDGLRCDMLLLSGGVSAGVLDLVPSVLQEAGVEQVFHKVNVKPGKPVWFGTRRLAPPSAGGIVDQTQISEALADTRTCLVFGLPGNPVSTLVCFELFAKSALRKLLGLIPSMPQSLPAVLAGTFENRGDRPTYHPALLTFGKDGRLTATTVRWAGSGDLRATVEANGVAIFEPSHSYAAGDIVNTLLWSGSEIVFRPERKHA